MEDLTVVALKEELTKQDIKYPRGANKAQLMILLAEGKLPAGNDDDKEEEEKNANVSKENENKNKSAVNQEDKPMTKEQKKRLEELEKDEEERANKGLVMKVNVKHNGTLYAKDSKVQVTGDLLKTFKKNGWV